MIDFEAELRRIVRDEMQRVKASEPVVPNSVKYLSAAQVAERTGYSPITLKKWRLAGKGPPFTKPHGRVMYPADELDAWLQSAHRGKPRARRV